MPRENACRTCRCFLGTPGTGRGLCRRYPPIVAGNNFLFPETHELTWCGEYEKRPDPPKAKTKGKKP